MASRRTRIKGIAHIPQRKKNQENDLSTDSCSKDNITANECIIKVLKEEKQTNELTHPTEVSTHDVTMASIKELPPTNKSELAFENTLENPINGNASETPINGNTYISNIVECLKNKMAQSSNTPNSKVTRMTNDYTKLNSENLDIEASTVSETSGLSQTKDMENGNGNQTPKVNIPRRKFLKPGINLNAVKKRTPTKDLTENLPIIENVTSSKEVVKQDISDRLEENSKSEKVVVLSEIRIPKFENKPVYGASDITKIVSVTKSGDKSLDQGSSYSEVTLNETHLGVSNIPIMKSSVVTFSPNIKRVIPETHNASDSEYPPPPPSPSKINRSRIKAIPRLSQRKTSCSASESEDETRKYGRIRNNSVCSIVSTSCLEPPTPASECAPPPVDVKPILPKKVNRTEQSRKLAEARREFHKRFGSNNPDKQQLKMIDLIFYNPSSNPMSIIPAKTDNDNADTEKERDEIVDDPSNVNVVEEKENDAESGMPVPQIKIGPSGEIILDEQSLIVENSEVVRQKEKLKNSRLVNGDFDTGYGIYKKVRRALSWSQKETVRFYKAINLVGTDFTVMLQLFPTRTRRELKMKFKKEEKINKQLIDRAIMQPCSYNFAELKREIEIEEEEEATLQKIKEEEMEKVKQAQLDKYAKKKLKREKREAEANAIKDINSTENTGEHIIHVEDKDNIILPPKKRLKLERSFKLKSLRKTKSKSLNITSVLDDSDADISDMETQTESEEEETIPYLKPTRSGRMPKSTERYTTIVDPAPKQYTYDKKKITEEAPTIQSSNSINTLTSVRGPPNGAIRDSRSSSLESNSDRLVPGAVVIMMEEDPVTGISEYKVFMVTPERKLESLNLPSEIVARLIKEKKEEENTEFLEPALPEKNVTIPATGLTGEKDSLKVDDVIVINCPD